MTLSADPYADAMSSRVPKRLTKRVIGKISEKISGFGEDVLKTISAAAYVTTFNDRVAFTETLRRHKQDIALLLQHNMADSFPSS